MGRNYFKLTAIWIIALVCISWSCSFAQDKIVAIVNNDIITQKDLNDFLQFMRMQLSAELRGEELESKIQSIKLDLLDRLIEDRLILQEAKRNNIIIDENMVKARLEEIKKRYPSDREFQNALASQGLVQADIETKIREQLLTRNIIENNIRSKIRVNPGEVTSFYQENIEQFMVPEEREVEAVSISDENLAKQLYNNLRDGDDFSDTAKRNSVAFNKFMVKKHQELRKDIEEAIFKLQINGVSRPIRVKEAFYIFKVVNIIPCRQQILSEVQDGIYALLIEKKMQERFVEWLDNLKKKSYIKVIQD